MELNNLKVDEVFNLLDEINKRYTAVFGWGLIETNKLVNFDDSSFIIKTSEADDHDLIEKFLNDFDFDLQDGYYEFKFLLSYSEAQIGDYPPPNIEVPAYYDYIDSTFEKKASIEDYNTAFNMDSDFNEDLPW